MKRAINTVRWLFSAIFGMILSLLVLITPFAIALSSAVLNKETVKVWVGQSGIYNNADELAIQFIKEQAQSSSENQQLDKAEIMLTQDRLEGIVKDVLTPAFTQNFIEGAVDGTYDYLEGKTEGIIVRADRDKVQDAFLQILIASSGLEYDSVDQVRNLPTCTPAQQEQLQEGFESIEDACLPEGLVLDQIFESQFGKSEGTGELDITSGGIDTSELENHFPAREAFQTLKILPYLLLSAIVAFAALTIIANPTLKTGLVFTGIMGIVPSLLSIALAALIYFTDFSNTLITSLTTTLKQPNSSLIEKLSQTILKDIFGRDLLYSLILLLLFTLILLSHKRIKSQAI